MKKLFCLLTVAVIFSVNAQNQTEYKPSLHETVLHAVKNKDISLLKETLYEMDEAEEIIDAREILPLIESDIFSALKFFGFLGAVGALFVYEFERLYPVLHVQLSVWEKVKLSSTGCLSLLALHGLRYLLYRKSYKILNILISSHVCYKTTGEIVFMERLRRLCVPMIYLFQEKCSLD